MMRSAFRPFRLPAGAGAALALVVALVPPAPAGPAEVDRDVLAAQQQRVEVIKKVRPAVISICKHGEAALGEAPVQPMASGFIISPDGYALTNFHVVDACRYRSRPQDGRMLAGLPDGILYDAVVCGIDKVGDVALIKLEPKEKGKPFPFVPLGDSDKVRAGDWSLAMGDPHSQAADFTPSVTYGAVSGVNRYQPPDPKGLIEYTDCIQIESINPGNSGGPLFNMRGEVIGINGRGSLGLRGRINSGVGYAVSINQVKNFLGHLRAGIDADHATLGALVGAASEDAPLARMVVKQILEESDAFRRGIKEGDQLLSFAGRTVSSPNQYKNVLGIYPKDWRVPLTLRRNNTRYEVLVRLMGNQPKVVEKPNQPPGTEPVEPPKGPAPKGAGAAMYEERKGYSNWYFNVVEQNKLLAEFKKGGDFTGAPGTWTLEGTFAMADRNGPMRVVVSESQGIAKVTMKLNIETSLEPLKQTETEVQQEPLGSGGLMMAMYHYHRFLTQGAKGFEGLFAHGGDEPFYPYPLDGVPKALAALRVDCAVLNTKHGSVPCKWYFSKADGTLLGFETFIDRDATKRTEDRDPCEVYLHDYKDVGGRKLPHRIEVRYHDKRYALLTVSAYKMDK
jgi:S1-C subfamily serine protease